MSNAPTLINLPPPPSDPVTPSDIPGTPNSTTTSMSELSTVAIKDGHRGHLPHHIHSQAPSSSGLSHQLDAERADRISRLAGLERVTTARGAPPTPSNNLTPGAVAAGSGTNGPIGASSFFSPTGGAYPNNNNNNATTQQQQQQQQQSQPTSSYFDATGNPVINRERSTVGSASATGSVGARTTWAGSEAGDYYNADKMSESQDMDMDTTSSVGAGSDEGDGESGAREGSLVGFGEGARTPARQSTIGSPGFAVGGSSGDGAGNKGSTPTARDAKMMDGGGGGGGMMGRLGSSGGAEEAERIVRENMTSADHMQVQHEGSGGLGKFGFEK